MNNKTLDRLAQTAAVALGVALGVAILLLLNVVVL